MRPGVVMRFRFDVGGLPRYGRDRPALPAVGSGCYPYAREAW